ncbi:GNAT family N-acetyltransferase [Mycolicibacterium sp. CR10]|uniref:lipid II:glycine glycyltransferase FemX n=1 Tax=Mycolicibacterium sp. CR10 TaxID=2562314 RepID=UPI001485AE69|nr:GNAT family N-acetyltransferase [Mycolicibacterium sp. CR10]
MPEVLMPKEKHEDGQRAPTVSLSVAPDARELKAWDELVRSVSGSDVAQLSAWADVRRSAGFEPLYLFAHFGGELVGGASVLQRRVPVVGSVGYLPYGPVIPLGPEREFVCRAMAYALRELARGTTRVLFVQPALDRDDCSAELRRLGFRPSQAGIAPVASLRLDLARDEVELRAGLRRRLRKWTKAWPKRGVTVRRGTPDDIGLLARLHAASARHQGFEPLSLDYLQTLYGRLAVDGHVELFIGEVEGIAVAARLYTGCGGVFKQRLIGMDRDSDAARLNVPAAVEWEAIRWSKGNGYKWFDFGGIRETTATVLDHESPDMSLLTGSEVFKASFGASPFRYPPPVEFFSSSVLRSGYDSALRWPSGRHALGRVTRVLRSGGSSSIKSEPQPGWDVGTRNGIGS